MTKRENMSNGNSNGGDGSSVMAAGWGEGYSEC